MNIKKSIGKIAAISVVAFSVLGCEQDFETLGSNIIGEPGFNADLYDESPLEVTSVNLPPVQTNNLPVHLLGFYDSQVYGGQTASILTQLSLLVNDPTFGDAPVVDSVVLKIPYFSTELEPDEDGSRNYELDSVIGTNPIKLTIQESGYFLNQFDPESGFELAQKYYSDMHPQIVNNLTGEVIYENPSFFPSKKEIVEYGLNDEGEEDTLYSPPAMRLKLSEKFFQEKILDQQGSANLASGSDFRNYLRGIYIQAEALNGSGHMTMLNLADAEAGITIYYTSEKADAADSDDDENTTEIIRLPNSYKFGFGPTELNTFQQETPSFESDNIFLKGGEGSMAVIELFKGPDLDDNGVSDELDLIRENGWLVNEANLTFYVNRELMNGEQEPDRLFLYDLKNSQILVDYVLDSPGEPNNFASKSNEAHLVPLVRDENENGISYKIRLTNHVNNLLNKDSTNVRLGLVVSQNVNFVNYSALKEQPLEGLSEVPSASVISPLGTVIYGPEAADEEKRLKLNIYYTEPKE